MAIKTRYLDKLDVVVHIGSETVTPGQILQAARDWEQHVDFHPGTSTVWDLVAAEFEVDWARIKEHGHEVAVSFQDVLDPGSKTAWVISDEVTGIILDSIHLAFPWPTQWKTFDDAETAIAWLRGCD